ncbi:beta-1,4-N-acetylgalactosaminyltransferase bre-4-like isoform X4 [Haliotis rufescens]|uniref:beta-1,4-N-acetylgalactosaminyltransferase bre-4-like isoform X4 n=1 Tax=Haliotis rufescens TaxID=6454 RepID=UPI00201F2E96|nr:beta-1,4-N-acetylgalactosaminyltransferase bre-4-like isoform X4 [Haliotis rufescens]
MAVETRCQYTVRRHPSWLLRHVVRTVRQDPLFKHVAFQLCPRGPKKKLLLALLVVCALSPVLKYVNVVSNVVSNVISPWRNIAFLEEMPDFREDTSQTKTTGSKQLCPKKAPNLVGVSSINESLVTLEGLIGKYISSRPGGHFKPPECVSRTKTAVIVAYRNRQRHLVVLLNHLIPFLVRQQADFAIFVVEPLPNVTFNRALLMNIGFVEALKTYNFTCFIFHDVDLLPVTDHNLYRCGATPRHMAVSNSKLDKLQWKHHPMSRYPPAIGRYIALNHADDIGNPVSDIRLALLETAEKRMAEDGLTSLKYKIIHRKYKPFYTWIQVDIDMNYYSSMVSKWQQ